MIKEQDERKGGMVVGPVILSGSETEDTMGGRVGGHIDENAWTWE